MGKKQNTTDDGLPILSKSSNSNQTDEGLPILKKKIEEPGNITSPSAAPSVSEGGTSGLEIMPSAPNVVSGGMTKKPGTDFNPFSEPPKEQKINTALGNKLTASKEMKSVSTMSGGQGVAPDSKVASNQNLINRDASTKSLVDTYETYKQNRSAEQAAVGKTPFAADDNKNTIDFFLSHLKETDPEDYKYVMQRQESLSKDKEEHLKSGNFEDADEDELMIQKTHAELLNRALALKTKVMGGKYELANNAIKDNYSGLIKQFNDAGNQASQLESKIQEIDSYLKENYEFQNGQIVTNPFNKKKAEEMLQQRQDLITQYEASQGKINEIRENGDFADSMALLDETQKTYDSLQKTYQDVKSKNPEAFNGLPAYKKQLEAEREAQKKKDMYEPITGDFGVNESIGRGFTSILSAGAFIPKSLGDAVGGITEAFGGKKESDYDWKDKMYDVVKSNVDDFDAEYNPLPSGYDKPVYDSETKEWNLKYLPGKVAGTVTEMAPIIATTLLTEGATAGILARMGASGEIGTSLGAFTGEYIAVADDYYTEAKNSGMSESEAMAFSQSTASVQALLGALYPDVKLLRAGALRKSMDTYAQQVAAGTTKMMAVKEAAKTYASLLAKEIPQENLQTISEINDKNEMYEKMGLDEKIKNSVKNDVIETTILTSIVTLGLGARGVKSPSRMQQESLYMAASQPTEIMESAQKLLDAGQITQQQFDDMSIKVEKATIALSKLDQSMPAEKKIKQLIPLMEKIDLKEELANLDDSQKDLINDKIQEKDKEIQDIITSPSEEEVQDYTDEENFFNDIRAQHDADQKALTEDQNKQQPEGMIELDDSNKSQPIELSVAPETLNTDQENISAITDPEKKKASEIEYIMKNLFSKVGEASANKIKEYADRITAGENRASVIDGLPKSFVNGIDEILNAGVEEKAPEEQQKPEKKKKPIKSAKDVKVGDVVSDVDGRTGTVTAVSEDKVSMDMDHGGKLNANPKVVELFVEEEETAPVSEEKKPKLDEEKIESIRKSMKDNKTNFFNEKISYDEYKKINESLEADLNRAMTTDISQTPSVEDIEKVQEEEIPEVVTERSADPVLEEEVEDAPVLKPKPATLSNELIDVEEEEDQTPQEEKADVVKKLNDDAEILKSFNKEKYPDKSKEEISALVEKKYIAALERAYKAKLDKSISGPTYTEYRNKLNEIMSGKINEYGNKSGEKVSGQEGKSLRNGEIKAQIAAIGEKVKEKLLGQGYKNIALSTGLPVTPKMIADMVDLTVKGVQLGIDLGYTVREATEKALNSIKKHPKYQKLLSSKGFSEKSFANEVEKSFSQVSVPPVTEAESVTEKPATQKPAKNNEGHRDEFGNFYPAETETESQTVATEKNTQAPEKPNAPVTEKGKTEDATQEPGKNKRKGARRIDENSQYSTISATIPTDEKYYNTISHKQIGQMVNDKISEYEQAGLLDTLADEILEGNSPFPSVSMAEALTRLGDRLNNLAEAEKNAAVQGILYDKASKLFSLYSKTGTELGQALSVFALAAARMPTSAAGLSSFVAEQMSNLQDQYMTDKNKKAVADLTETVNSLVQQELEKIATATQSKEWVDKVVSSLDALRIDLSEC